MEDKTVYKDIKFNEILLSDLMDKSNRILKSFYTCKFIMEKEVKYFWYDLKEASNLDKFYYYLKFMSTFLMYLEDLESPAVKLQKRKHQSFLIFV